MRDRVKLFNNDCLVEMKNIPDKSIDMILCDLPYGTTACKWDVVIPFEPLWKEYKRIIKDRGCIALFGSEPFSSYLRMSNIKNYKYDIIWEKTRPTGFFIAKKQIMKIHENISVFYKEQTTYNPIKTKADESKIDKRKTLNPTYNPYLRVIKNRVKDDGYRYPTSILKFKSVSQKGQHESQKPVDLLEYLIKTYSNPEETILDNCMGSGSTGVACINTNRNFIGIEKDKTYFNIAEKRINEAMENFQTELFRGVINA